MALIRTQTRLAPLLPGLTRCPVEGRRCVGCPDCTGLYWSELHDRMADLEDGRRQQAAIDATGDDWSTR